MRIDLTDTTAADVAAALSRTRRAHGPASGGRVLTLVAVTDEDGAHEALATAGDASREFAARIVVLALRLPGAGGVASGAVGAGAGVASGGVGAPGGADSVEASYRPDRPYATRRAGPPPGTHRLDASITTGRDAPGGGGEAVVLRLYGAPAEHPDAVLLPLLLPDAPVVAWWPGGGPEHPAADPVGALAGRRVTDARRHPDPRHALCMRARDYVPGDTDLAWTRLTRWRFLLASALDQAPWRVDSVALEAAPDDPSALLLARWLRDRLGTADASVSPVRGGAGVTVAGGDTTAAGDGQAAMRAVRLSGGAGVTELVRDAGGAALLDIPGWPVRKVALPDRTPTDLLREELHRLDPDPTYAGALRAMTYQPKPRRHVDA